MHIYTTNYVTSWKKERVGNREAISSTRASEETRVGGAQRVWGRELLSDRALPGSGGVLLSK